METTLERSNTTKMYLPKQGVVTGKLSRLQQASSGELKTFCPVTHIALPAALYAAGLLPTHQLTVTVKGDQTVSGKTYPQYVRATLEIRPLLSKSISNQLAGHALSNKAAHAVGL